MKKVVEVVFDSLTKKKVEGDYAEHYLALDDRGVILQLSTESYKKLEEVLKPFMDGEDDSVQPLTHYTERRKTVRRVPTLTPEEKEQVREYARKHNLGEVSPTGRVRKAWVGAWRASLKLEEGKPQKPDVPAVKTPAAPEPSATAPKPPVPAVDHAKNKLPGAAAPARPNGVPTPRKK